MFSRILNEPESYGLSSRLNNGFSLATVKADEYVNQSAICKVYVVAYGIQLPVEGHLPCICSLIGSAALGSRDVRDTTDILNKRDACSM
jgi:hypothetical protein